MTAVIEELRFVVIFYLDGLHLRSGGYALLHPSYENPSGR